MDAHRSQSPRGAGREADEAHARRPALPRRCAAAGLLAGVLGVTLVGCAGESGTEITPSAAQLSRISAEADTVRVGEQTDPPLAVRVENGLGEPLEGVPVRFLVASGPGAVVPSNVAVSSEQGIAEAAFLAGSEFGRSRVRVDVPSAANVSPLSFSVVTLPAREVTLQAQAGDGQQAEVRSQLPVPFSVRVVTPSGTPAGGVPVVWELADGAPGAALSADTTFTGPEGETGTLLTLGDEPVDHVVRAFAVGGVVTDTVRFSAAALVVLDGPARVDSVAPVPLRAGEEATLFGEGFGQRAENVEVRIEGVGAEAIETSGASVRFRVPSFADRCLPTRRVGVRAIVRGDPSNGSFAVLRPAQAPLSLDVGEIRRLGGGSAGDCVVLSAPPDAAEYLLVVGSAARGATGSTPLRLVLESAEETPDAESRLAESPSSPEEDRDLAGRLDPAAWAWRGSVEALREAEFRRAEASDGLIRPNVSAQGPGPPSEGETLRFRFAVGSDFSISCADTSRTIEATARFVGDRVVLAEDVESPPGGFSASDWQEIGRELDDVIFPTDTLHFGGPADIDGNDRVTFLFTPEVNRLTPQNSPSFLSGFFLPLDLVDSGDAAGSGLQGIDGESCPASNESELLYLATADPEGRFGNVVETERAKRRVRRVSAHELEHLLSAEQRLLFGDAGFTDLGATWLQEGLAHMAEEIVGLRQMELEPPRNVGWGDVISDRSRMELFNVFHGENFTRLSLFLRNPTSAPVLAEVDPGGLEGLQMRGFAWLFVRWLADRADAPSVPSLTRSLSRGGSGAAEGIANVEQATGEGWGALIGDFLTALPLDDGLPGPASELGVETWDLRSIFAGLSENPGTRSLFPTPFPLSEVRLSFESTALDFDLRPATAAYVRLRDRGGERGLAFHLRSQTGGPPPSSAAPLISLVRTE